MEKRRSLHHVLLLALVQMATPSSASGRGFITQPESIRVALGDPAEFRCGAPAGTPRLLFTFTSNHGNYSLICPDGHLEDIPQAVSGSCEEQEEELVAVWSVKGTSYSDDGARVECQQTDSPVVLSAVLRVYDSGTNLAVLIGCTIGAFFGMMLVFALSYLLLWRSHSCRACFGGSDGEDDTVTIVTEDEKSQEQKEDEKTRKKKEAEL